MDPRHARQSFLGAHAEHVIANLRVGIVGLCGGGSHIAQQLAHIGVGHFELVDFDIADTTNLNRMVGLTAFDAHAGVPKTIVIERMIRAINPHATVIVHSRRWGEVQNALKPCMALFGCVDRYSERDALERFARRYLIPYIDVGMDVHQMANGHLISGQVILSLPSAPCLRCFGFITEERLGEEAAAYGDAGGNPQVVWPNGILASTAVGKFMQLVLPWSTGHVPPLYTEYDGNRHILRTSMKAAVVPSICSHYPAADVGDAHWHGSLPAIGPR